MGGPVTCVEELHNLFKIHWNKILYLQLKGIITWTSIDIDKQKQHSVFQLRVHTIVVSTKEHIHKMIGTNLHALLKTKTHQQ